MGRCLRSSRMTRVAGAAAVLGLASHQARAQCDDMTYESQQIYPPQPALKVASLSAAARDYFAVAFVRADEQGLAIIYARNSSGDWEAEASIPPLVPTWSGPYPQGLRGSNLLLQSDEVDGNSLVPHVLLYTRTAPEQWTLVCEFPINDGPLPFYYDQFALGDGFVVCRTVTNPGAEENPEFHDLLRIYQPDDAGVWSETWREETIDVGPNWDTHGAFLLASEDSIFVGRPYTTITRPAQGSVTIYARNVAGQWERRQVVTSPEPRSSGNFGSIIAASGDHLVVLEQADTFARCYARADAASPFLLMQSFALVEPAAQVQWGSMSGDHLVLSAGGNGTRNTWCGAARRYDLDADGLWQLGPVLEAHDNSEDDYYGLYSHAAEGYILVVAPYNRFPGEIPANEYPGSLYIFEEPVTPTPFLYNERNTDNQLVLQTYCATPRRQVDFYRALGLGQSSVDGCPGSALQLHRAVLLGSAQADNTGKAKIKRYIPNQASGLLVYFQAVDRATCRITNVSAYQVPD